jgi:hypothetical protein
LNRGIKVNDVCIDLNRLAIAASKVEPGAKDEVAASIHGVQLHCAAGGGNALVKLPHRNQKIAAQP